MCIKDMINDSKDMVVSRSIDMRLAVAKRGEADTPIKCCSIHRSASTPLWKIALWMLGIIAALVILLRIMKCKRKKCNCECEPDRE